MHIRQARADDAAAIARVHVDCWRSTYRGIVPDAVLDRLSYQERENQWIGIVHDRLKHTFVSEVEGAVVGFVNGGPERTKDPVYRGELYAIYLLADHQRRGIGRALVRELASRLARDGTSTMLSWCLTDNPSRRFYEALGGVEVRRKLHRIGGKNLEEIAYGWADLTK